MLNRSRWPRALGRSANWRYYAIVVTADGHDLNELLVSNGLARIYGTRTPLPDGRDSRTYLAHLHELENEARAAKRGAWGIGATGKEWGIIIENLRNAGWNCGCLATTDGKGRPIWVVAAERDDAERFIGACR